MTSRRKQMKPSKAQSDLLLGHNSFSTSNFVEEKREDTHSIATTIMSNEDYVEIKMIEPQTIGVKPECTDEKVIGNERYGIPIDKSVEDLTKKIHKDDAKILPIESNGGIEFFQCPLCFESSICGRENLTCHLQEHQNKTKRDDGKHLCCLCSKELSSNSSLERHLLTHSNHRPFSCILCDKKFTTNGNLSRHIKTSHNNNGTIESSIDEVLKKHQMESYLTTTTDNSTIKLKKSHKSLKKEPLNLDVLGLKNCRMNMGFLGQPLSYAHNSKINNCTYQSSMQNPNSNINVYSPLYSFNVNDFGFVHANLSENINLLTKTNLSIFQNNSNIDILNSRNNFKVLKRKQFDSLLPKRLLIAKRYKRKINFHIHKISHTKNFISSTNSIECAKCRSRIMLTDHVLSHIRYCYKMHKRNHLFCPFTLCSRKFSTLKNILKHIKNNHLELYCHAIEPVTPLVEPLNLSIKKSTNYSSVSIKNLSSTKNNINLTSISNCNSIDILPNSPDLSIQISSFQTINQFISTPTIVSISPFQFSTPLAFSASSFLSKPMSVPVIVNNGSEKSNSSTSWSDKISHCTSLDHLTKSSNDGETRVCTTVNSSLSTKYITGIKKKNSYKDAPKLITCPMDGCVQKFPWNSSLMRHILTHTAHKPFKCTRCVKSFSTKSNRERHMTRVHRVRINRSKFKSLQSSKTAMEDSIRTIEDGIESENGADGLSMQDSEMRIIELSEEEWIIMDDNDRRAEDISSNLLKLAGQPIVEPNPVRLHNVDKKYDINKYDSAIKKMSSLSNETLLFLDNCI